MGDRFNELVQYKAKHGNCNVPQKQGTLGTWVCSQRVAYKAGSLAQGRIDRLNSIGFSWVMAKGGSKGDWETRFKELVQYKTKHGDCNIPFRQGQLGGWVGRQRNTHKEGKLSHDRIDRLNAIGFDWTPPRRGSRTRQRGGSKGDWDTRFKALVQYKANHGDCNIPARQGQLGR